MASVRVYTKEFLDGMRHNPVQTIESAFSVKLTAEQRDAINKTDWNLADQPLSDKITKRGLTAIFR